MTTIISATILIINSNMLLLVLYTMHDKRSYASHGSGSWAPHMSYDDDGDYY